MGLEEEMDTQNTARCPVYTGFQLLKSSPQVLLSWACHHPCDIQLGRDVLDMVKQDNKSDLSISTQNMHYIFGWGLYLNLLAIICWLRRHASASRSCCKNRISVLVVHICR
mmetsp:Transcript_28674/g.46309  ORF Transcript_28674/g.46309 Transcript_28674/m.46309 type:complete len:111 (+) Transcript_28674:1972-2304(+)